MAVRKRFDVVLQSKWGNCSRCLRFKGRKRVLIGHGELPADLLGVLHYPNHNEDLSGKVLIGDAIKLLVESMGRAAQMAGLVKVPSIYLTYACACGVEVATDEEYWACSQRLMEVARYAKVKRVILFGKDVQRVCKKLFPGAAKLQYPEWVSALGGRSSPMHIQFTRELAKVFEELTNEKT